MHLNALDIETAGQVLPTSADKLTSVVTGQGIRPDVSQKTQGARVLDMMVLGPAMVYAGLGKELPQTLKAVMLLTGIGTIIYNAYNYHEKQRRL